jgi:putative ABC transport system ATP-binding protein
MSVSFAGEQTNLNGRRFQGSRSLAALSGDVLTFRDGEALVVEGDEGDEVFVLLRGAAEVSFRRGGPSFGIGEGGVVGEVAALTGAPRGATVTARGVVDALRLRREVFLRLLREMPEVSLALSRTLARRLSDANAAPR